jgi:hypothetical protein
MEYFAHKEFLAIIETKVNARTVNLISPTLIKLGQYQSKVYCENAHTVQLENIQGQDIRLMDKFSLPEMANINPYLFELILFICNNLKVDLNNSTAQNHREESYSSLGIKNNTYVRATHSFGEKGTEILTRGLINNIDQKEIDWGLMYYFSKNVRSDEQGIQLELIHPECCCTFFIPIKCTKGIFTTLRIKARDIKHLSTHHSYSHEQSQSLPHFKRISSEELLTPIPDSRLSIMSSPLEFKFMVKRFLRRGRFILEP